MPKNKSTVHEWLLTMPEDLAIEAVALTPPSMLREKASCLSHALSVAFIWKDSKWERIYYDNMPNFMGILVEYREYMNLSQVARNMGVKRQKMEALMKDEDKHTPQLNEKLMFLMGNLLMDLNSVTDKDFVCQENQGQGQ